LRVRTLAPLGIEAALAAAERLEADHDGALAQWRHAVERASYETKRAERRYMAVDPDNRLVARGLEAEWEKCLRDLEAASAELARREQQRPMSLDSDQRRRLLELGADLTAAWQTPTTSSRDKKELLRTLIEEVIVSVQKQERRANLTLRWRGGALTEATLDLPCQSASNFDPRSASKIDPLRSSFRWFRKSLRTWVAGLFLCSTARLFLRPD
jgi:hypothetical protein